MSTTPEESTGEITLFESNDGEVHVEVLLESETVWLTQEQMAELFGRERSVITKHVNNVFKEGELDKESNVQILHIASGGDRPTTLYNLDMIISVGYRIKSKRGTQFRQWATGVLKEYTIRGYALNEKRLEQQGIEHRKAVELLGRTLENRHLISDEGQAVLDVVQKYARSWRLLREYDENKLKKNPGDESREITGLTLEQARVVIGALRDQLVAQGEDPGLFGQERGDGLDSVLGNIEQTFGGEPLYPTVESRSAHLLYFIIKDHVLVDGNKRSGALLFLDYLRRNGLLYKNDGSQRVTDTALVGLALLVAESQPSDKELMISLIENLLLDESA